MASGICWLSITPGVTPIGFVLGLLGRKRLKLLARSDRFELPPLKSLWLLYSFRRSRKTTPRTADTRYRAS
jgi:hypothetical protein